MQEKLIILPNGSRIEGVSLENILSAAGAAVDFAVVDEAAQIAPEAWYRAILPPLMDRNGGALLISSFEGDAGFFAEKVVEVRAEIERAKAHGFEYKPQWELFQGASYEVNFYAFPQGIHTQSLMDARKETPIVDFLEQYGAQAAGSRGRVYREFVEQVHCGNYPFNPELPVQLAIDPSSGANPYAIAAIQDYKDYVVVIDELYEKGVKVEDYGPILQRKPWHTNVVDGVCDSAWPHDIQRWSEMGYNVYPVQKPRVDESIGVVKEMLRNSRLYDAFYRSRLNYYLREAGHPENSDAFLPKEVMHEIAQQVEESLAPENLTEEDVAYLRECSQFFINRPCVSLIGELKSYQYRQNPSGGNVDENPLKKNDHLADACLVPGTMVTTRNGLVPIERVQVGAEVLTRKGFRRVKHAWQASPDADIVVVPLDNGESLRGTSDHKVWTENRGWSVLGSLTPLDTLNGCSELKKSNSKDIRTDVTQIQNERRTGVTSALANFDVKASLSTFTKKCGDLFMARFPVATMFTTSTLIAGTTTSPTSNVSRPTTISQGTQCLTKNASGDENDFLPSNRLQRSGTLLLKDVLGTLNMPLRRTPLVSPWLPFVANVEKDMSHGLDVPTDSVPTTVSQRGDVTSTSMTKIERVLNVVRRFGGTNISESAFVVDRAVRPIAGVVRVGRSPVYDLEVEGEHEFFADGVLVSNCRYYIWMNKRWSATDHPSLRSYLSEYHGPKELPEGVLEAPKLTPEQRMGAAWLAEHRNRFSRQGGSRSYMGVA